MVKEATYTFYDISSGKREIVSGFFREGKHLSVIEIPGDSLVKGKYLKLSRKYRGKDFDNDVNASWYKAPTNTPIDYHGYWSQDGFEYLFTIEVD
jgi:hypothetical protein